MMGDVLQNSELFDRLKDGAVVVVPDSGYAANLKQQFSDYCATTDSFWSSALIFSWQDWLKQLWQQYQWESGDERIVLNDLQQRLLWQRVIETDSIRNTDTVLWNINASISQARQAWTIVHDFSLDLSDHPHLARDVRVFNRWFNTYLSLLQENNWLDPCQLASVLMTITPKIKCQPVCLTGFFSFTPAQSAFFMCVFNRPLKNTHNIIDQPQKFSLFEFADADAELTACANWARELHLSNSMQRIGILVADLNATSAKVDTIFKSVFVPDYVLGSNQCDVYEFTHQSQLIDQGLVYSALNCLELASEEFDYEVFSRFLRDGYLARDSVDVHMLCQIDVKLRRLLHTNTSLFEILTWLTRLQSEDDIDAGRLISQLQNLYAYIKNIEKKASIISWCDHFATMLAMLDWPDFKALDSAEKLLFKQWDQLFAVVCTAGLVHDQISVNQALLLLKNAAANRRAKNNLARIKIVDIDDSAGMYFDAIWVCGLNDNVLPKPTRLNPLIPFQLQRDHELPYSSPADCQARAKALLTQLSTMATSIRFSYYKCDESVNYRLSSLLTEQAVITVETPTLNASIKANPVSFDYYFDDKGLPLTQASAIGGSYLLKSQAQCPFKAYAENRLDVEPLDSREIGLDPAERGTLVHQLLQDLWQRLKNKSALLELSSDQLTQLVRQQVDEIIGSLNHSKKLFAEVESNRLIQLALNWLTMEKNRSHDFKIKSLELPVSFSLGGLEFKLKVDRIDELEDGTLLVIDYKTGRATKSSWLDQRVQDPQLPVYYFALDQQAGAICFANTKTLTFDGLSDVDVKIKGITQVDKSNRGKLKNFENWTQLTSHWQSNIEMLIAEVKDGLATVTPQTLNHCKFCGRQSLCRINQHQLLQDSDDE